MSLGTWDPDSQNKTLTTDEIDIRPYIAMGEVNSVEKTVNDLSTDQINSLTPLMKQERAFWHNIAENLENDEITNLIRFFTLAEEKHSQLYAGNKSPVIGMNQILKQRNCPLSKDFLQWLKLNSSNRFIPNGSVM